MIRAAASLAVAGVLLATASVPEPAIVIRNNGPTANRVNMVIMGDGYTAAELSRFATDVDVFVADMFRQPPFSTYANYFNVTRIDVESNQSGVSHPERGVSVPSALGSTYNCGGIQRLICTSTSLVNGVLTRSVPADARDMVLVMVNDAEYGGSGGAYSVVSSHPAAVEIGIHEFGHSFGLLADEYTTQPPTCVNTVEPAQVNATSVVTRASIKWNIWIDPATAVPTVGTQAGVPGLYEGAKYCPTGLYRPTYDSKMRTLGRPFEQINTQQLILRTYNFVNPIDLAVPAETALTRQCGATADFLVEPVRPTGFDLAIQWRVNGVLAGRSPTFSLNTLRTGLGTHTVEVEVSDPTTAVRQDPLNLLKATRQWTVTVTPPAAPSVFGFPERGCGAVPEILERAR